MFGKCWEVLRVSLVNVLGSKELEIFIILYYLITFTRKTLGLPNIYHTFTRKTCGLEDAHVSQGEMFKEPRIGRGSGPFQSTCAGGQSLPFGLRHFRLVVQPTVPLNGGTVPFSACDGRVLVALGRHRYA